MKKILRVLTGASGMVLINVGVAFVAETTIGSDSLTLLMEALTNNFGLTIGKWNTILGVIFLLISLYCDKKKIGFSTFFYIIVGQYVIDCLMIIIPTASNIFINALYFAIATITISFGSALGVSARLGLSYYDAFTFSVTDRFNLNYVVFRYIVEGSFILISFILHEYPGIGTILYFMVFGPCAKAALKLIKAPLRRFFGLEIEY